jgi:hypothetical protein
MKTTDLTIEILKGIREEIRGTNAELREMKAEMGGLKAEMGGLKAEMAGVKAEIGLHGKAIVKLIHEVHGLNERFDNFLHGAHHEDHADLRARVGRLEAKVG